MKIMLDPGHYGKYNNSPANRDYWESEVMWKLCGYLKTALEGYGIAVGVTRTDASKDRALHERGMAAKGYDLFVSLHSNAVGSGVNEDTDYPVVLVPLNKMGDAIGNKLAAVVEQTMKTKQKGRILSKAGSNGADYYGVIRGAVSVGVVGILIEHSFHTQTAATNWLLSESNLKVLANAEAAAIAEHYGISNGQQTAKEDEYVVDTRNISINGKDTEMNVIMKDGRTFVELRSFEKAGYEIDYNAAEKKAIMNFVPVMKVADVNGTERALEMVMIAGTNYVKLRELAKVGVEVGYDDERRIPVLRI